MFNIHSDPLVAIGTQENGGQNVYVRSLMKELDRLGWSVDVYTRWNNSRKKKIVPVGKSSRVIRLKAGPISHVPKFDLHQYLPEFYRNFLQFINNTNPYDIAHGHYWDGGWVALQAHEQFKLPFVQTYHSLGKVRHDVKARYTQATPDKHLDARFVVEERVGRSASIVLTLSATEKRDLNELYGIPLEKIVVIPGAVNFRVFYPMAREYARAELNLSPREFVVVYVGRLEWRKGLGTLISAVSLLKKDIPNIKAVIVGGGIHGKHKNQEDFKEYQRLLGRARQAGVEDRMNFIGRVSHSKIHLYYSAGNIQVVPSYYEPFGLVVLEGMACQVPVVASRKGGLRMTIDDGKTGLLFEPRNAHDLRTKILQLYQSPELVGTLVKNAYHKVRQHYSWKDTGQRIGFLYTDLINSPPPNP